MIYEVKAITYAYSYGEKDEENYESPDYEEEYEFNTEEEAEEFIKTEIELAIKEYAEHWDYYDVEEDDELGCISLSFTKHNASSLNMAVTTWHKFWL